MRSARRARDSQLGRWELGLSPVGAVAAGFTMMCCLGVSAALSFAGSVGATFLTRDSSLRPILVGTLAFTVAASALTWWRHRDTLWPLLATVVASVAIYVAVFGGVSHGSGADTMNDGMADHATAVHGHGLSGGRLAVAWVATAVMVAAQIWDLRRVRATRRAGAGAVAVG